MPASRNDAATAQQSRGRRRVGIAARAGLQVADVCGVLVEAMSAVAGAGGLGDRSAPAAERDRWRSGGHLGGQRGDRDIDGQRDGDDGPTAPHRTCAPHGSAATNGTARRRATQLFRALRVLHRCDSELVPSGCDESARDPHAAWLAGIVAGQQLAGHRIGTCHLHWCARMARRSLLRFANAKDKSALCKHEFLAHHLSHRSLLSGANVWARRRQRMVSALDPVPDSPLSAHEVAADPTRAPHSPPSPPRQAGREPPAAGTPALSTTQDRGPP